MDLNNHNSWIWLHSNDLNANIPCLNKQTNTMRFCLFGMRRTLLHNFTPNNGSTLSGNAFRISKTCP